MIVLLVNKHIDNISNCLEMPKPIIVGINISSSIFDLWFSSSSHQFQKKKRTFIALIPPDRDKKRTLGGNKLYRDKQNDLIIKNHIFM